MIIITTIIILQVYIFCRHICNSILRYVVVKRLICLFFFLLYRWRIKKWNVHALHRSSETISLDHCSNGWHHFWVWSMAQGYHWSDATAQAGYAMMMMMMMMMIMNIWTHRFTWPHFTAVIDANRHQNSPIAQSMWNIRKHFLCNRIVNVWNSLPAAADDFATVRSFTRLIERVDLSEYLVY